MTDDDPDNDPEFRQRSLDELELNDRARNWPRDDGKFVTEEDFRWFDKWHDEQKRKSLA